jgi:murein DD-endopeptidase MepM/ murein hydrolase activator NlpD
MKKNWTILLVPHDNIKVRDFILTRPLIIMGAILVFAIVVGLGALGYGYLSERVSERELVGLQRENESLKGKVSKLNSLTETLAKKLSAIDEVEDEYRTIAGLSGIDPDVKKAGVGGAATRGEVLEGSVGGIEKTIRESILHNEKTLDALIRQADILYQSLTESVDQLKYYQDRLRHTPSIWPTLGRVTSGYGDRVHPVFEGISRHEGIDISARQGTPIVASADGVVKYARWKLGYGQAVEVDHGYGVTTFYAHLSKIKAKKGDMVKRGEVIGLMGDTGVATGPHLHYEVRVAGKSKNPLTYILGYSVPD